MLLQLGVAHGHGLQDFQEVLAAAVLTTLFIVGLDAGLIPGPNLSHLDLGPDGLPKVWQQRSEIDEVFAGVIKRDELATKDGFRIDWTKFQLMVFDQPRKFLEQGTPLFTKRVVLLQLFNRRHSNRAAPGLKGVVLAARILDELEHFLARDTLATTGVLTGGRQHLTDFSTPVGLAQNLGATPWRSITFPRVLPHPAKITVFHHDGGRFLQTSRLFRHGQRRTALWVGVGLKLGQRHDLHESSPCFRS